MFAPLTKQQNADFLDTVAVNKCTIDVRILASDFAPGQEVEVFYRRTKRWHKAVILYSFLDLHVYTDADGTQVNAFWWRHECEVVDTSIAASRITATEWWDATEIRAVQS